VNSLIISGGLLGVLVLVVLVGQAVGRRLPEHHLSSESKDAVKLAMGLVATMTALLLGLLVSSAKGSYDTERSEVLQLAAQTTFLDRVLALYGPETADARARFRNLMTDYVRRMWPERPRVKASPALDEEAGNALYLAVDRLEPRDETQRGLKAQAMRLLVELGQVRTLLLVQSISSIARPLLIAVACWLVIIFLGFSVVAPPNATTGLALIASAFSVAGAVFLILELDQPLGGLIRIPSEPMVDALSHLEK
jgi:hypothetical protein